MGLVENEGVENIVSGVIFFTYYSWFITHGSLKS